MFLVKMSPISTLYERCRIDLRAEIHVTRSHSDNRLDLDSGPILPFLKRNLLSSCTSIFITDFDHTHLTLKNSNRMREFSNSLTCKPTSESSLHCNNRCLLAA